MNTIEKIEQPADIQIRPNLKTPGTYPPQEIVDKINELVDRVNQLAKPILICRIPGRDLRRYEGGPSKITDSIRRSITEIVGDDYHILCTTDDEVTGITFEVHNQQTEIAKTLIIQLENFKMPSENGEQA